MASQSTLDTLIELARERKTDAAQEFAKAVARAQQSKQRLELLQNYRGEYETRMRTQAGVGIGGAQIANYNRFIAQLTDAYEQQELEVTQCDALVEHTRLAFLAEERKLKSFEILADRAEQRQTASDAKRTQKQFDEFAARSAFAGANSRF